MVCNGYEEKSDQIKEHVFNTGMRESTLQGYDVRSPHQEKINAPGLQYMEQIL